MKYPYPNLTPNVAVPPTARLIHPRHSHDEGVVATGNIFTKGRNILRPLYFFITI
jgi:hypothetical protein